MSSAPAFTELTDLAGEQVGGRILFATDDWFAVAENLLKSSEAEWRETAFTEFGKWMDGWETRRKRIPGHDWCIIQLGAPGIIHGFDVNTEYFSGNYTPRMSIQAACLDKSYPAREGDRMGSKASEEEFEKIKELDSESWVTLVEQHKLGAGYKETCHNFFPVNNQQRWTHLRLNMFPDGGIARFKAYGTVTVDWSKVPDNQEIDLLAVENGAVCTGFSDAHYGHPRNLMVKRRARIMAEGWETARRLDRPAVLEADNNGVLKVPGCEWAEFKLGHPGVVKKIEIDTNHFKGNYPDSCTIEACLGEPNSDTVWKTLLPAQKLSAHHQHYYDASDSIGPVSHVRVVIRPDGGISRLRLHGCIARLNES